MVESQNIYTPTDVDIAIKRFVLTLRRTVDALGERSLVIVDGKLKVNTRLQSLFNIKFTDDIEKRVYEIMITHALASERLGPGAFDECITLTLDNLLKIHRGILQPNKMNSSRVFDGYTRGKHPTKYDVMNIVKRYSVDENLERMIMTAIELAGFGGRIVVEKTMSNTRSVELVRGYTFDVSPAIPSNVRLNRPRIAVIDGFVEDVGELHHLLESASEAKEPVVLFVRGMSGDVIHTLKVNFDRGSLKVMPVIVKFDLEGINALNDIAVVSGTDVVSSAKGDLISTIKFNQLKTVESVVVYPNKVIITNSCTARAVASQVSMLMKKRNDESAVHDVAALYDRRVKSLSPNQVVVRLPDDKDFVVNSQSIDYVLRTIRSAIDYGVDDASQLVSTKHAAVIYADRCAATIADIGAIVTLSGDPPHSSRSRA